MSRAMFLMKTVLLLSLYPTITISAEVLSVCDLSIEGQCGLITIGLKDICDCLASKGICFQEIKKIKNTFAPYCKNMHEFRENCMKQLPCGKGGGGGSLHTLRKREVEETKSVELEDVLPHSWGLKSGEETRLPETPPPTDLPLPTTQLAALTTPKGNVTAQKEALERLRAFSDEAEPNSPGILHGLLTELLKKTQEEPVTGEPVGKDPLALESEAEQENRDGSVDGNTFMKKVNDFFG